MTDTLVGFVGIANPHAEAYRRSLAELPVEITCACDTTGTVEADSYDYPVYSEVPTLFENEDIDVAWISLSNRETPAAIERAAEHGVDVFAEKTLARTSDELAPVVKRVEEAGVTVVPAYIRRANPATRELRSRVANGFYGDLRAVEARMMASQLERFRDASGYAYRADESRGGILQWLGCHVIDQLFYVLEESAARVNGQVDQGTAGVDVEDGASVQFELAESEAIGTLQAGYYVREYDTHLGIYGRDGATRWPVTKTGRDLDRLDNENYDVRMVASRETVEFEHADAPGYGGKVGLRYMANFLDAVEGREHDPNLNATIYDSLRVLEFLDGVYESAENGNWVEL